MKPLAPLVTRSAAPIHLSSTMTTPEEEAAAEPQQQLQQIREHDRELDDAKSNNGRPDPASPPAPDPPREPSAAAGDEEELSGEALSRERRQAAPAPSALCEKEPTSERSTRGGSGASPATAANRPVLRCQGKGKGKGRAKEAPSAAQAVSAAAKKAGDAAAAAAAAGVGIEGTPPANYILKKGQGKRPRTGGQSHKRGRQEEEAEVRRGKADRGGFECIPRGFFRHLHPIVFDSADCHLPPQQSSSLGFTSNIFELSCCEGL